jgi:hypothetical protein
MQNSGLRIFALTIQRNFVTKFAPCGDGIRIPDKGILRVNKVHQAGNIGGGVAPAVSGYYYYYYYYYGSTARDH